MSYNALEEIFNRYIAMQDSHMEILNNNIAGLEQDKPLIDDLDFLTVQRDLLYQEIQDYFENEFSQEKNDSYEAGNSLNYLLEKLQFIMGREDKLKTLVEKNSELLSLKLGRMRQGKNALNAYNKSAESIF
jgi:hypothetical protein